MGRGVRILALGGVLGPVLFSAVVVLCAALRPDYAHLRNFISELGATGTPHASLMNYGAFLPTGLSIAALGVSLASRLREHWLFLLGALLVVLFGAGVTTSGFVSCDAGCPFGGSPENRAHQALAPAIFLAAILGTAVLGIAFRALPTWRPLWLYSLATSGLAFVLLGALAVSLASRELTGLWQRGMVGALFLWCVVVGLWCFRHPDAPRA